jgi:hypothetical protein
MRTLPLRAVRATIVRQVDSFDPDDARHRLCRGQGDGDFRLLTSGDWPSNEAAFDVAADEQTLHVTVMTQEAANLGLVLDGFARDAETVEVFVDPFHDGIGYRQFGAGSDGDRYEGSHWPYRDIATLRHRDVNWSVAVDLEEERPDVRRFYHFQLALDSVFAGPCIGFNVGRSQARIQEHSMWNWASGIGFCDPSCFGRLWLAPPAMQISDASIAIHDGRPAAFRGTVRGACGSAVACQVLAPSGATFAAAPAAQDQDQLIATFDAPSELSEVGRYRVVFTGADQLEPAEFTFDRGAAEAAVQFQGTYDWPDHILNVPYGPDDLAREMQWYADHGMQRVYWLDYTLEYLRSRPFAVKTRPGGRDNLETSIGRFDGDFLRPAVDAAHAAGMEFVTVYKPFEQNACLPFIKDHPHVCAAANPAWAQDANGAVSAVQIYQVDDRPFPFTPDNVELLISEDNETYQAIPHVDVTIEVVERPLAVWSPAGLLRGNETRPVRCLRLSGFSAPAAYWALVITEGDAAGTVCNREYQLAELVYADGRVLCCQATTANALPEDGFALGAQRVNEAAWGRCDTGIEQVLSARGPAFAIGLTACREARMPGFVEPSYPDVQEHWLACLRRGVDAGADAVSMRIAHHVGSADWLSFMYAEPVLQAFRDQFGRAPEPSTDDYTRIRRIRGDAYTAFVRAASDVAHSAGIRLIHHLENRMLVPVTMDTYCQIEWQWQRWITEGLVDEIDLKYIGPDNPAYWQQIVPLCRRHDVKINWILADPEPRSKPRSIYEGRSFVRRARAGALHGINLYELWLYRRMTSRGTPMTRGSAAAILTEMQDELNR